MYARGLRTAAAVGAIAVIVAACGGSDGGSVADPVSEPAAAETTAPVATDAPTGADVDAPTEADAPAADPAPAADAPEILRFSAPLVGGGELDAASTAGTPTAFWFWAPT